MSALLMKNELINEILSAIIEIKNKFPQQYEYLNETSAMSIYHGKSISVRELKKYLESLKTLLETF